MIKNISIKKYHEFDGLSKSMMDKLAQSPAHLKASLEEPEKETEALILGQLFHTLVLEPKKFEKEFAISPDVDRRTSLGKQMYQAFCEENEGKTIITKTQLEQVAKWVAAVKAHPIASKLLSGAGKNEVSIFWNDPETGELCKARPDRIKDGYIIDLKSTISSQQDDFCRKAYELNYHIQSAWFCEGYEQEFKEKPKGFIFIAVEKTSPYNVVVYYADDYMIEAGAYEARKLLNTYHRCKETNNWYGYDGEEQVAQELSLPNYAVAKYTNLI